MSARFPSPTPPRLESSTDSPTLAPRRRRRRVLVIAACPFPASHGTPGSIKELVEGTAEQGHEVHVVTYHMGEPIPVKNVTLHRIRNLTGESEVVVGPTRRKPLYDLQLLMLAIKVIRKHNIEVVHAHGYEAMIVASICRALTGRRVVYSAHNQMGDELASYNFFRFRWLATGIAWLLDRTVPCRADLCIPHSDNLRRFLEGRGLADRTRAVVDFGIDLRDFPQGDRERRRRSLGLTDEPVMMYAGVLDGFQRIDLLIDALRHACRYEPRLKLVLVVSVPQHEHVQRIRAAAQEAGVADRLVITDPVDVRTGCELLSACDVAVVPRPAAVAFPIKLLNYMAAQRPAVMFRSSASGVTHDDNIWLVDQDTGEALGEGVLTLLRDSRLRERLAERAYRFVRNRHDRSIACRRLNLAYSKVLKPKSMKLARAKKMARARRRAPRNVPTGGIELNAFPESSRVG